MRVLARVVSMPKAGHAADEYEDACWPEQEEERETPVFRCAVADGATETSFSGLWARMLVRAYARGELSRRRLPRCLPAMQKAWLAEVMAKPLPWYAEEKVRAGAFAALAGLSLSAGRDTGIRWDTLAIGDSCLFHVRDGALLTALPLAASGAFNNRPHLLSTSGPRNARLGRSLLRRSGRAEIGDTFFLMTDALACWALRLDEGDAPPWSCLSSARFDLASFHEWITSLRAAKLLRNDDVTLLAVHIR